MINKYNSNIAFFYSTDLQEIILSLACILYCCRKNSDKFLDLGMNDNYVFR